MSSKEEARLHARVATELAGVLGRMCDSVQKGSELLVINGSPSRLIFRGYCVLV